LKGEYAFYVQGYEGANAGKPIALAASFTADGTGKVTAGEEDSTTSTPTPTHVTINPTGSSYVVGSDNRGCVTLVEAGPAGTTKTFRFALGGLSGAPAVASKGRIIEFDDVVGTGRRASGVLRLQTTTDFLASQLKANYAFGMDGLDSVGGHYVVGGSFSLNINSGVITPLSSDFDDGIFPAPSVGTISGIGGSGSLTLSALSSTTGRVPGSLALDAAHTYTLAIYIINANEFFAITTDTLSATQPILSGRMIATKNSFTNTDAAGTDMIHINGISPAVPAPATPAKANGTVGILTLTTGGAISGNLYNSDGSTNAVAAGTYTVASPSAGRVTLASVGSNPPVLYLTTPTDGISAFIIGNDNSAGFGYAEAQNPTSGYTASSLTGKYFFGLDEVTDNSDFIQSHVLNIASAVVQPGAGSVGDSSDQTGLIINSFDVTNMYTVNASGDGSGTFVSGTFTSTFVTDGKKMFLVDQSVGGIGNIFAVDQ
jgi:hypothetical protein